MKSLIKKTALVTGAGSGLGKAIALNLAKHGVRVGVNDIHASIIDDTVSEIRGLGMDAMRLKCDVGDVAQVRDMFSEIVRQWGSVDILVNNAGIAIPDSWADYKDAQIAASKKMAKEIAETGKVSESMKITSNFKDEYWHLTMKVHLDGTFYCTREALKIMEAKGGGKIINIASIHGIHGGAGMPAYSAAKSAIIGFTRSVAQEVIGSGIIVNSVAPGFIETPLLDNMEEDMKRAMVAQTPAGRLGTPEEISSLVTYLASEQGNYIVGQVISPNGGIVI